MLGGDKSWGSCRRPFPFPQMLVLLHTGCGWELGWGAGAGHDGGTPGAHPAGLPHPQPPAHSATSSSTSCKTWWTMSMTSMSNPRRTQGTAATGRAVPAMAGASMPGGHGGIPGDLWVSGGLLWAGRSPALGMCRGSLYLSLPPFLSCRVQGPGGAG